MLLSDFNGPEANQSFLPTGPSGLDRFSRGDRFGDHRGGSSRFGDDEGRSEGNWRGSSRGSRFGGGGSNRDDDGGDMGRSDRGQWRRGGERKGGFGSDRYGGGGYGGGDRDRRGYGDRGERDTGGGFRRSGGSRFGNDDGGFSRDRFGRGGGGGGGGYSSSRFGGDRDRGDSSYSSSRWGGGRSSYRDERPAHLRRFRKQTDEQSDSLQNRNTFGALGSQDVRTNDINSLGRAPVRGAPISSSSEQVKGKEGQSEDGSRRQGGSAGKGAGSTPSKGQGPQVANKKKTAFEQALEDGETLSNKQLKNGLKKLDLNDADTEAKLSISLAKSLKEKKLSLSQVQENLLKVADSEGIAIRVLANTLSKLKGIEGNDDDDEQKGEEVVSGLLEEEKFTVEQLLKGKKTGAEFNEFLKKVGLEFLKGGADSGSLIEAALEEDQKPEEILDAINSVVGEDEDVSAHTRIVANYVAKKVISSNVKLLDQYHPLLARCIKGNPMAAVQICFALQGEWFAQKPKEKQLIITAFKKIHELKLCDHEEFYAWQTDRKEKTKGKQKALLAVFKFLSEVKAKNKPIEDFDEDEDEDQNEDQDEDEFDADAQPHFIK